MCLLLGRAWREGRHHRLFHHSCHMLSQGAAVQKNPPSVQSFVRIWSVQYVNATICCVVEPWKFKSTKTPMLLRGSHFAWGTQLFVGCHVQTKPFWLPSDQGRVWTSLAPIGLRVSQDALLEIMAQVRS